MTAFQLGFLTGAISIVIAAGLMCFVFALISLRKEDDQ